MLLRFGNAPTARTPGVESFRRRHYLAESIARIDRPVAAIDILICLHPIKIDPRTLPPVRSNGPRLVPYGQQSRSILNHLRTCSGTPQTTIGIALVVAAEHNLETTPKRMQEPRIVLLKAINHLLKRVLVGRLHPADS